MLMFNEGPRMWVGLRLALLECKEILSTLVKTVESRTPRWS